MMIRFSLAVLWLSCVMLTLGSAIVDERAHAQYLCSAGSGDHPTAAAGLISFSTAAGNCTEGTASDSQYDDPTSLPTDIKFALFLPGSGSRSGASNSVKFLARDAAGAAISIGDIVCIVRPDNGPPFDAPQSVGGAVGTVTLDDGESCHFVVSFGVDSLTRTTSDPLFIGGTLSRDNDTYTIEEGQLLDGDFGTPTPAESGFAANLERDGTVLQTYIFALPGGSAMPFDLLIDELDAQTVGSPVTLVYRLTNVGTAGSQLGGPWLGFVNGGNIQSLAISPVDPRAPDAPLASFDRYLYTGASLEFEVTFVPSHATEFSFRIDGVLADKPFTITVRGPGDEPDDPTEERTERIIKNFMVRRGGQIISKEPDLTKRLGRRTPPRRSLKDAPPLKLGGPVTITGKGTEHNNRLAFSTSLRQVAGSLLSAKQQRVGDTAAAMRELRTKGPRGAGDRPKNSDARDADHTSDLGGAMGLGYGGYGRPQTGFGLWAEGNWARINDGTTGSDFGLLYIGADYRFRPGFVVGLLAQIDQTDEEDQTNNFSIKGRGWLAGPYVVARLSSKLILDARAAWGKSDNEVSPYNTYADKFEGRRWLARGRLTGDFEFGRLHIAPHIGVVYFEEEQKAYTDSLGNTISSQKVELGRLTFGPKLSTTFTRPDGATVTPHVAVHGIWDFRRTDLVNIDTGLALTGTDDFRARAQAGVTARRADGMAITAEGFYDGIGAKDFDAYGGTLRIDMPF
ncbi:MAG: autotransporter outer membrane beta-barrel domain-containing protein [Pseudomonadota bacterium]